MQKQRSEVCKTKAAFLITDVQYEEGFFLFSELQGWEQSHKLTKKAASHSWVSGFPALLKS